MHAILDVNSHVSEPVVLRIVRPYENTDDFIRAEGWTLSRRGAVLLEQPELPPETPVRFVIALSSGERLVLAEGVVVSVLQPKDNRPGGLKVRFTRCGSSTKEFIERVLQGVARMATPVPSRSNGSRYPAASAPALRPGRAVAAPVNRDELLDQLRRRHLSRHQAAAQTEAQKPDA